MADVSTAKGPFGRRRSSAGAGVEAEESAQSATKIIEAGDFCINVPARQVSLRGHELSLTAAEFDVLVFLTGHPKSFATPHTMLATSWTGGYVRQAEFLRALLSLTKKLDLEIGGTQHYIRTEPWIFYRFDPDASSAL